MTDSNADAKRARIFYARVDEFARKEDKYKFLDDAGSLGGVAWQELHPDAKHTWLTEGMRDEFESFLPMGTKEAKQRTSEEAETLFKAFSLGVSTNRDAVVHDFNEGALAIRVEKFCEDYNAEVARYRQKGKPKNIDDFLKYDEIKWSRNLKRHLRTGNKASFDKQRLYKSIYRPFTKKFLYLSEIIVDELGQNLSFFPKAETVNKVVMVPSAGGRTNFWCFCVDVVPNLALTSMDGSQCFPLYTYNEDGTNRHQNITDWVLAQFRAQYADQSITKLDIFHYVYALLHHPTYRATYAANLRRELPRIPFVKDSADFRAFVRAGARLAELHVNYEAQPEYKLERVENPDAALDWRVEKMKLSKDKTAIAYNDFLTLEGIPPAAFEYRLGNRSALEWIIDQYQVSTDKRSGITNDPNRADEPDYIVKLIGKITTVSVETVKTVRGLPALQLPEASK